MQIFLKDRNHNQNWLVFYIILYLSLIIGLLLGENSTGGAILDYTNQKKISQDFSNNFYNSLFNYDQYSTRHSPILIIFLSFFEKINLSDIFIRFIHLNLTLILPIYFFKTLNLVIKNKNLVFFLVSLIFISPTFRSLAIWPDSRILGLSFFLIGIYQYIKFKKEKKFNYCIKNILFVSISSYISPNFSLFAIFFFFEFFLFYKKNLEFILYIVFLNILLSLPAFIYLFSLESNFLLKTAATNLEMDNKNMFFTNIFNNILLISSIIFFYTIPFYVFRIFRFDNQKNFAKILGFTVSLFLISILFFDYNYEYTGGGIFFKISYFLFKNNFLFYIIALISLIFIFDKIYLNFKNSLLILLILLSNPQITVYHKYYDPFLIILFFTLFNIKIDTKRLENYKTQILIFMYFFLFLIINNLKLYVQ